MAPSRRPASASPEDPAASVSGSSPTFDRQPLLPSSSSAAAALDENEDLYSSFPGSQQGSSVNAYRDDSGKYDATAALMRRMGVSPERRVKVTADDNARVLHRIDLFVLPLMLGVYFLQSLDKATLAYASVFGLIEDAGLQGDEFSWLGSIVYIAQLIAQFPLAWLLVKLPIGKFTSCMVVLWGATLTLMTFCKTFHSLLFARFWLGAFEASIAPSFVAITQMFWRRREQPLRMSYWYAMNGFTSMFGSLMTWALARLSFGLRPYQVIFLFFGLITMIFSSVLFLYMPDSPAEAKFLSKHDKLIAVERLRMNQMGVLSRRWRWDHLWETLRDPKTWLWFTLIFSISVPSGGVSTFGPLLVKSFGFDSFQAILFNIPFGVVQLASTVGGAFVAMKYHKKGPVIAVLTLAPIFGCMVMLATPHTRENKSTLLFGYYLISVYPGTIPLIYSWSSSNTAGDTKGKCTSAILFVGQSLGNIIGPLLYRPSDAPEYVRGLQANMVMYCTIIVAVGVTSVYIIYLNQGHRNRRVAAGKAAVVIDYSLYSPEDVERLRRATDRSRQQSDDDDDTGISAGVHAFDDLTDLQNNEFVFVL